jgi:hypothetical protein
MGRQIQAAINGNAFAPVEQKRRYLLTIYCESLNQCLVAAVFVMTKYERQSHLQIKSLSIYWLAHTENAQN